MHGLKAIMKEKRIKTNKGNLKNKQKLMKWLKKK